MPINVKGVVIFLKRRDYYDKDRPIVEGCRLIFLNYIRRNQPKPPGRFPEEVSENNGK